ncbi:MAG: hypothetical protein IK130_02170 [Oscillospiraceae bacterium]|nr:hypothetical protein [Oscillospiraceae bacterium]
MKNKIFATMAAGGLSSYGIAGFWSNLGNETIHPVLFASMLTAMVLAPVAVIIAACLRTSRMPQQRIGGKGVLWLLLSAVSFIGFWLWLTHGGSLAGGKLFALISGLLLACSAATLVYAVTCFILAVSKKNRQNSICPPYTEM